jgi:hypothetical protein
MKPAIIGVFLLASVCSRAQTPVDTAYRVEVTVTASPMINFFRLPRVPGTDSRTSAGYGTSLRVLWHPGRLLSVGLLSGYFVVAKDDIPVSHLSPARNYSARLSAVPLQIALSMRKYDLEIGVEIGTYLMMTTITGGNSPPAYGKRLELGTTIFGSYLFTLNDTFQIGPELRVVDLRYRGIVSVMPSCSIRIIPLRY